MDPLHEVQALVESATPGIKEDTYLKICNALRAVYNEREDNKIFEVVMTRVSAQSVYDSEGDPDVAVHVWTTPATLVCQPVESETAAVMCTPMSLLLSGQYRRNWLTNDVPFVIQDGTESVTVMRVRPAKRSRPL